MAKTTFTLCNHRLNTQSIKELAIELAAIYQVNIQYGLRNTIEKDKNGNLTANDEEDIKGVITNPNYKKTYTLLYDDIDIDTLQQNLGFNITLEAVNNIEEPFYFYLVNRTDEISYKLWDNEIEEVICIYKNVLELDCSYIELNLMQELFLYKMDDTSLNFLKESRMEQYEQMKKFGGNFVIHICDENESYILEEWFIKYGIETTFNKTEKTFKNQIVNICQYISSKAYIGKPQKPFFPTAISYLRKLELAEKHKVDIDPIEKKYPIVFYDDFKDIDISLKNHYPQFQYVYDSSILFSKINQTNIYQSNLSFIREKKKFDLDSNWKKYYAGFIRSNNDLKSNYIEMDLKLNQEVYLKLESESPYKNCIGIYVYYQYLNDEIPKKYMIGYIEERDSQNILKQNTIENIKGFLTKFEEGLLDIGIWDKAFYISIYYYGNKK